MGTVPRCATTLSLYHASVVRDCPHVFPYIYLQFEGGYAIVRVIENVLLFELEESVTKG